MPELLKISTNILHFKANSMIRIIIATLLIVLSLRIDAQRWTDHFNLSDAKFSCVYDGKLIAGSSHGLFYYDAEDRYMGKMTKVNMLSDMDISTVVASNKLMAVGYQNGNLDVIKGDKVFNIPDIKLSRLYPDKAINSILIEGSRLYCCTNFGIVVINIDKKEVADTYYIGTESKNYMVNSVMFDDQWIYAATSNGLYRADKSSHSLSYYKTWQKIANDELAYSDVVFFDSKVIAFRGTKGGVVSMHEWDGSNWEQYENITQFQGVSISDNTLYIATKGSIRALYEGSKSSTQLFNRYSLADSETSVSPSITNVSLENSTGRFVIADSKLGLVYVSQAGEGISVVPNSPATNNSFDIVGTSKGVFITPGGLTNAWNNHNRRIALSRYSDGVWTSYINNNHPYERDLLNIAINPNAIDSMYVSTWGNGIFKFNGIEEEAHYTQQNSILNNVPYVNSQNYVRVGGICYDNKSNLFISNCEVNTGLIVKTPDNKWYPLYYPPLEGMHSIGKMIVTRDNILWAIIPRIAPGLFVLSTNGTIENSADDMYRSPILSDSDKRNRGQLLLWDENREAITNSIKTICEDKNGQIWLGTNMGVIVYYRPGQIFNTDYPIASRIKVPRNDGTNAADYLLGNEVVTAICVDGANRKWIGTEASGVFLVSPDGLETIQAFNSNNSPLPSDAVTSIGIHPTTGEVFIGTSQGIVSYVGDAIEPIVKSSSVKIYPNPVRENYSGEVTIDGFEFDSEVIITDIRGALVYKTISRGGRVVWNCTNLNGSKAKTGVYLVLAADSEGNKSVEGKILIVK